MERLAASAVNVALRALSMLGRFVLLIVLAAFLEPAEVGLFGLFAAANQWGLYFVGLDFYTYSIRELVSLERSAWPERIRDAFTLYATVFGLSAPVWAALFFCEVLPWRVAAWFYLLLLLEHVGQELYRLLVGAGLPLRASLVLFLRSGAWMFVVALVIWRVPSLRRLDTIWWAWAIGALCAATLGAVFLYDLWSPSIHRRDWTWIRRGLAISLPFLAGTLALRGITVFERMLLEQMHGPAAVGVYSFFGGLAGAIPVLADTGLATIMVPRIIEAARHGPAFRRQLRELALGLGILIVILGAGSVIAIRLIVARLRPEYDIGLPVFWILLAAAIINVLGLIPHYALYARRRDRVLVRSAIGGLAVAVLLDFWWIPAWGGRGAAWGQLCAMAFVAGAKAAALLADRAAPAEVRP